MLKLSRDHGYQMGAGGQWWNTFKWCLFITISITLQAQILTSGWGMETRFWGMLGPAITSHTSKFQLDVHFICPMLAMTHSLRKKHLGDSTVTCLLKGIRVCICMVEFCQLKKPMQFRLHSGLFSVCCYPLLLFWGAPTCIYFIRKHSARSSTSCISVSRHVNAFLAIMLVSTLVYFVVCLNS